MNVAYKTQRVGYVNEFCREVGAKDAPLLFLLHGFPTSSHIFRDLIPLLADRNRVIAPDLPGFGQTDAPGRGGFAYTLDHLVKVIDAFSQAVGLQRYAL
jgi:pimeloyl-ACP methyl ester carboxylesterase